MPNFFSALDSDDEGAPAPPSAPVKKEQQPNNKKPEKENRPRHNPNKDRNTKTGRGGPREAREGKRQFDRRSGTGRGKEIKKGGGGARNWGNDKNAAKKLEHQSVADAANDSEAENPTVVEEEKKEEVVEEVVEEEPDNRMTIDEYLASKKETSGLLAAKKGKTLDNDEFAGKTAHKIVEEDFLVATKVKSSKKKTSGRDKEAVTGNFKFGGNKEGGNDRERRQRRDGDNRRGRGGGRDRDNRGGKKTTQQSVNVMDAAAFPTLVSN